MAEKFAVQIVNAQDALMVQISKSKTRTVASAGDYADLPKSSQFAIAQMKDVGTIENKGFRWYAPGFLDALTKKQNESLVTYVASCPIVPTAPDGFTFDALAWIKSGSHAAWFAVAQWCTAQKTDKGNAIAKLQSRAHVINAALVARGADLGELSAQWAAPNGQESALPSDANQGQESALPSDANQGQESALPSDALM